MLVLQRFITVQHPRLIVLSFPDVMLLPGCTAFVLKGLQIG